MRASLVCERFLITDEHTEILDKRAYTNKWTDGQTDASKHIIFLALRLINIAFNNLTQQRSES